MTWTPPWDYGITWRSEQVEPPTDPVLSLSYVRDKVLRVANGSVDDEHIRRLIESIADTAERDNQWGVRLSPQTWRDTLSAFPCGDIELSQRPVIDIVSFNYLDGDGETQSMLGSPETYLLARAGVRPSKLRPVDGGSWPSVSQYGDAVTIEYRVGFEDWTKTPAPSILNGIILCIDSQYNLGELPSRETLRRFWGERNGLI